MTTILAVCLIVAIVYIFVATLLLAKAHEEIAWLETTIRTLKENHRKDAAQRQADVDALEALNETLGKEVERLRSQADAMIDQNRQLDAEHRATMQRLEEANERIQSARNALVDREENWKNAWAAYNAKQA